MVHSSFMYGSPQGTTTSISPVLHFHCSLTSHVSLSLHHSIHRNLVHNNNYYKTEKAGIVGQQKKTEKLSRDDSIKQLTMQPHRTYLFMLKICRVGLYIELLYAIIPTWFPCFLLFSYPYISLHFCCSLVL